MYLQGGKWKELFCVRGPVKFCLLRAILKLLLSNRRRKAMFAYFFGSMNTGYFCTRLFCSSRREAVIGVNQNVDSFCRKFYILVRRQQYNTHAVHMHYSYLLGLSKGCDFKVSRWSHTYYSFYNTSFTLTSACTARMSLELSFTCVCGCVQTAVHCLVRPSQLVIDPQTPTKLTFLTAG